MPFVKLDCGILNSTLWFERDCREVFLTALLMAEPVELQEAMPQIQVRSLDPTGWEVPPGWYGLAPAAGLGIIDRAKVEREAGLLALEQLGSPEQASRSQEFDGRRLVRVDGGYIVLNYMKYRERDYTSAERSKRYRMRLAEAASRRSADKSRRDITQAEAEVEAEKIKDQDHRADARKAFKVLTRLAHDAYASAPDDAKDVLKALAARNGIPYDAGVITKALDAAERQRKKAL